MHICDRYRSTGIDFAYQHQTNNFLLLFVLSFWSFFMIKRAFIKTAAALALMAAFGTAQAQNTPIKFQLDWRFEGPAALF